MKRRIAFVVILVSVICSSAGVIGHKTFANRGTTPFNCTSDSKGDTRPNDTDTFPFGFICGSDISVGAPVIQVTKDMVNTIPGTTVRISGKYSPVGPPKYKDNQGNIREASGVLVWFTIDGDEPLTSDSTYSPVSPGGGSSANCPGSGRAKVYGFTDNLGGGPNGDNQSPYAYNPNNKTGIVDCGEKGKMVFWTNAPHTIRGQASTDAANNFSFDAKLAPGKTGSTCVRMNVSVQFNSNDPWFPSNESSNSSAAAGHIAKQSSDWTCINVNNFEPNGTLNITSCSSYSAWGYDPDHENDGVYYRLIGPSGGVITPAPWPITSKGDSSSRSQGFSPGVTYRMQIFDPDISQWVTVSEDNCGNPNAMDAKTYMATDYKPGWRMDNVNLEPGQKAYYRSHISNNRSVATIYNRWDCIQPGYEADPSKGPACGRNAITIGANKSVDVGNANGSDGDPSFETYYTNENTPLGTLFCKQMHLQWLTGSNPPSATADGNTVCAYTAGGHSQAQTVTQNGTSTAYAEPGQSVSFFPNVATHDFTRLDGTDYEYYLNCSNQIYGLVNYDVGCSSGRLTVASSANLFQPTGGYQIPADAYSGDVCNKLTIISAGSTINGPNANLIGNGEANACSHVVGGKTSISASAEPGDAEPQEPIKFNWTMTTGSFNPSTKNDYKYDVTCKYKLYFTRSYGVPANTEVDSGKCDQAISADGSITGTPSYTVATDNYIGNQLCMDVTISPNGSNVNSNPNWNLIGHASDHVCVEIVAKPYMKVYGGSVSAGNNYPGQPCRNPNASVMGWNKGDNGEPAGDSFRGAGAQLAVFAQDQIKGFASAQGSKGWGGFATAPSGLSFANASTRPDNTQQVYGTAFADNTCISDYYGSLPTDARTWSSLAAANDVVRSGEPNPVFKANGPLVLNGTPDNSANRITLGNNTKLYVDGDVYITGDINTETGANSVAQVPNFTLIAKGNIYISPQVGYLYGNYVAQPNGASGGNIYTCAPQNGTYNNANTSYVKRENYTVCKQKQLVVDGSFTAKRVYLLRTYGSRYMDNGGSVPGGSGDTNAGEVFRYNPLVWMRQSATDWTASNASFDAITTLPPVL